MKILKVYRRKNKYIVELGRELPNNADVRICFVLLYILRRLLTGAM